MFANKSAISISYGLAPSCYDYKYKASAWHNRYSFGFLNAPLNLDETDPKSLKSLIRSVNGKMKVNLFSESGKVCNTFMIDYMEC